MASVFKTAGALFFILAIIFIGVWALKRYGPAIGMGGLKNAGLELLGQLPLGPKRGLAVVRFQDRTLVLGVTEHQINLVAEMDSDQTQGDSSLNSGGGLGGDKDVATTFSKFMEEKQSGSDS